MHILQIKDKDSNVWVNLISNDKFVYFSHEKYAKEWCEFFTKNNHNYYYRCIKLPIITEYVIKCMENNFSNFFGKLIVRLLT